MPSDVLITPASSKIDFTDGSNATKRLSISGTAFSFNSNLNVLSSTSLGSAFKAEGVNGTLFEVTDDLSNSLMSVNTIGGLPVFEVFANNSIIAGQYNANDFVISGNKVGIGLASPAYKLQVSGSSGNQAKIGDIIFGSTTAGSNNITAATSFGSNGNLNINASGQTDQIWLISSSGNVGIGTASATSKLTLVQSSGADSVLLELQSNNDPGIRFGRSTYGSLIRHVSATTDYIAFNCSGTSQPAVSATAQIIFDENGNVGVGTLTPLNKIHIAGSASVGSSYNVAAPTNGLIVQGDVGVGTSSLVYSNANRGVIEVYGTTDSLIALRGSTTNSYLQKSGNDFYLVNGGAGVIAINTNGSERWRITSAGVLQSNGAQTVQTSTGNLTLASAAGNGNIFLLPNGTGSVGVGTNSPTQFLDVRGNIKLGADNAGSYIYYVKDNEGTIISTARSDVTQAGLFRSDGWGNFTVDKSIGIGYSLGTGFASSTIGNGNLYVLNTIGINTTSPLTKLDVRGGSITSGTANSTSGSTIIAGYYTSGALTVLGTEQASGGPVLGYAVTPSTSATGAFLSSTTIAISRSAYTQDGGTHRWYIGASQTVAIGNAVTTSEVMRINSSGNLGIGVTNPAYKLDVNGTTRFGGIVYNESVEIDDFNYFNLQPYIESETLSTILSINGTAPSFVTLTNTAAPFSKVLSVSAYGEALMGDYIPVQAGETIYGEIWTYRATGAAGTAGVIYCGVQRYDKDKKMIDGNGGLNTPPSGYFIASNQTIPSNSTWTKYSGTLVLPTSHTPYNTSDGGPVRYIRPYIIYNYTAGTILTYIGGWKIRKVELTRDVGPVAINGNVGIGTLTPSAKLSTGATSGMKLLVYDNPSTGVYTGLGQDLAAGNSTDLFAHSLSNLGFITFGKIGTNGSTYTEWGRFNTSGNLGIGTTSPVSTLHLNSAAPTILTLSSASYVSTYLTTFGVDSGARAFLIFGNNGENQIRAGRTTTGGYLDFYTNNTVGQTTLASDGNFVMRLTAGGNIGVGATTAANKLTVSGPVSIGSDYNTAAPTNGLIVQGSFGAGTTSPDLKVHIDAANAYPASSGTTPNGYLTLRAKTAGGTHGMYLGVANASPYGSWIQCSDSGNLATNYPLLLNPNGGSVGIGLTNPSYKLDVGAVGSGSISVRLTPGYERVRYYGFDLLGYNDGNLWMMGNNPTNTLLLSNNWDWDYQIAISYTPSTIGAAGGSLEIGQMTKNNANFTHGNTRFYTNGIERLRIINNGNVGIGISSPAARLHINSTTSGATLLRADGTNGTLFSVVDDLSDSLMSVNNSAGLPVLEVFADDRVVAGQYGANDFVLVNNKLGLGTNNPQYKLDVRDNITSEPYSVAFFRNTNTSTSFGGVVLNGDNQAHIRFLTGASTWGAAGAKQWQIRTGQASNVDALSIYSWTVGADVLYINNSGNIGIGNISPIAKLDIASTQSNGIIMRFDTTTNYQAWIRPYWNSNTDSRIDFAINRTSGATPDVIMSVGYGSNVGVGTVTPSAKLHVVGPSILANNSAINPDSYLGSVVAGNVADGSGWGVTGGIAGNGNANGRTWAMGSSGNFFYMGFQNGATGGSLQTFLQVSGPNRDLYLVPTSGSVGIGTTAPVTRLQIGSGTTTGATLGIQFGDDTETRLYRSASGIVTCSGTIAATFSGNLTGNVTGNVTGSSGSCTGNAAGSSTFVAGLGVLNYDIDRTTKRVGLSHYTGYSTGTNRPTTYDYTLQVTDGSKGWEISMDWIATTGPAIYARSLRDCCQNWSSWVRILDSANYSFAANMNQNVRTTDNVAFGVIKGDSGSDYPHSFTNTDSGNTHWTNRGGRLLTSNGANWATDGRDPIMALVTSGNTNNANIANSIGLALHNESQNNTFSPAITFSNLSNSGNYNTAYAAIIGRRTGQGVDTNWSAGELHFYTMPVGAYVSNIPSLIIKSDGNVGIGTTAPAATLQVGTGTPTASGNGIQFGDDTTARLYRSSSGVVSVSNSFAAVNGYVYASNYLQTGNNLIYPSSQSATQRLEVGNAANNAWIDGLTIAPGGNVVVAGTLTESSSIRYKENIQTISAPILPKLNEIRPVTYNKKDNPNNIEYGIIAEELNDLFPEFVNKNDKGEVESVNYSRLTVLLIKAVKELKDEVDRLKNK